MKIVYLAGLAHCGSTYLSRVLNQHPDIFSAGELLDVHEAFKSIEQSQFDCPCKNNGKETRNGGDCSFWSDIKSRLEQRDWEATAAARLSINRRLEWIQALGAFLINKKQTNFVRYNRELFKNICKLSGCKVVLDSSKTLWRLLPLKQGFGDQVKILHLYKSPRNQLASRLRRGYNFYHSLVLKYLRKNGLLRLWFKGDADYLQVSFEKFLNNPDRTLNTIFNWMNLHRMEPFSIPSRPFHHMAGGYLKHKNELPPPKSEILEKKKPFSNLQRKILDLTEPLLNPGTE